MPPTVNQSTQLTRGYTIALISAAILSTTAILVRYLTQTYQIPALVLAYWREIFTAVTLVLTFAIWKRDRLVLHRRDWVFMTAYGLVLALFNSLWTLSVAINGASVATVLVYCSTAFTAILGWLLLGEKLDWAKILAVCVCLGGCVLVSEALNPDIWKMNFLGILTGVLAGLGYAGYSLVGKVAAQREINAWTSTLYVFGAASVFMLGINLLSNGMIPGAAEKQADMFWLGDAWLGWAALLLLAAGPTVIGFGLYNLSLNYLSSSVTNLVVTLEPVFTVITAYVLLKERLSQIQIMGSVMILAGVVFLRIYEGWNLRRINSISAVAGTLER